MPSNCLCGNKWLNFGSEGRLYNSLHYIWVNCKYLFLPSKSSLSVSTLQIFFEGPASRAGEPNELLIDSQGSCGWAHLTAKLSNAAQMASNILLKVIIHFNVAAVWPGEGCSSPSFCLSLDTKNFPVSPRWLTTTCSVFSTEGEGQEHSPLTSKLNKGE